MVAWDVEQSESAELAAELVSRACLKERIINEGSPLEVRLEELGVLRSFSRPRVSNDSHCSEPLFHIVKYRMFNSGCYLAARRMIAPGFTFLWVGIKTNTTIAASNSLRLSKGIAMWLFRSAANETMFMHMHAWQIQNVGADKFVAGN